MKTIYMGRWLSVVWSPTDWWIGIMRDPGSGVWCISILPTIVIEVGL